MPTRRHGRRSAVVGVNLAVVAVAAWAFMGMRTGTPPDLVASTSYTTTTVVLTTTLPTTDTTSAPTTEAPPSTVEDTSAPTTTPEDGGDGGGSPQTTAPATTLPNGATTTIVNGLQDIYGDVCVPLNWVNCAVYIIYNAQGEVRNQVIANSDWTLEYIAEASGGGADGTAVKVRDIYPCDTCVSYVG
ncbi:MAG: hypothetical protein ACKOYG_05740 [Ilumatobacteraceae bacterium]